jgi:hypothetical protein
MVRREARRLTTWRTQYEFRLAQLFHDMEVPFIAYGVPELTAAGYRWTDEVRGVTGVECLECCPTLLAG